MSSRTSLTGRISRDLELTRPLLDRLPEAALTWRPHPRSFTLAGLGTHIARLPHWGAQLLAEDRHDLAAGGRRVQRIPLTKPLTSISVTSDAKPLLFGIFIGAPELQVFDAVSGSLLRTVAEVGFTPSTLVTR